MRVGILIGLLVTMLALWRFSTQPSMVAPQEFPQETAEALESAPAPAQTPEPNVPEAQAIEAPDRVVRPTHYTWWPPFGGELTAQRFARYISAETGLHFVVSPDAERQYRVLLACEACDLDAARAQLVRTLNTLIDMEPAVP